MDEEELRQAIKQKLESGLSPELIKRTLPIQPQDSLRFSEIVKEIQEGEEEPEQEEPIEEEAELEDSFENDTELQRIDRSFFGERYNKPIFFRADSDLMKKLNSVRYGSKAGTIRKALSEFFQKQEEG